MSTAGSRELRRSGTGLYIALFLVVTALAVAGYWTLIPHSSVSVSTPAPAPAPAAPSLPPVSVVAAAPEPEPPAPVPAEPEPEMREEPAAPAQSAVTVTLPEPDPELAIEPPALVVNPLVGETVAAFSMEQLSYSETMGDWRVHDGLDLAAEPGTPVCAASSGTVLDVRDDDLLGTTVVISHDGGYDTLYSNLQAQPTVEIGDYVTAGQTIGSVGNTALGESALPPHLHFGVSKDGEPMDPAQFLRP